MKERREEKRREGKDRWRKGEKRRKREKESKATIKVKWRREKKRREFCKDYGMVRGGKR